MKCSSQDLRPSVIDDVGLLPALDWLVSDLEGQFDLTIGMAVLGTERRFPPNVELVLFRIAQEALRNVWRHSGASRAWLTVEFGDGKTTLCLRLSRPPHRYEFRPTGWASRSQLNRNVRA